MAINNDKFLDYHKELEWQIKQYIGYSSETEQSKIKDAHLLNSNLSEQEFLTLLALSQARDIRKIKSYLKFFVILTLIGMAAAFIYLMIIIA